MHHPRRAVVPIVRRHAPGFLSRLHLLEQIGMIALFDPKDIMTTMIMQGLNVGRIRTQAIFGDDELEMGVVLPGFCRKVRFLGKIQKSGVKNSMTYRLPTSRKSNFATEPAHRPGPSPAPALHAEDR